MKVRVNNKLVEVDRHYVINWTERRLDKIAEHEDEARQVLYAFVKKYRYGDKYRKEILYIGIAQRQYFKDRFKNHHKLPHIKEWMKGKWGDIVVKLGTVEVKKGGKNLTRNRVEEIENALIYYMEPLFNEKKVWSYTGKPIVVENKGTYKPFPRKIYIDRSGIVELEE